ncbi:DUF4262 domain-containing protein [Georgenia halophila]
MSWEEIEVRQRALIEEHGWMVQTVEPEPDTVPFAYTVGLTRYHDHPELLVSGLPAEVAGPVLNQMGRQVREGERFTAGDVLVKDGTELFFVLLPVEDPYEMVTAQEIYNDDGARPVPGLQMVWSDAYGRLPWEEQWLGGWPQELFS